MIAVLTAELFILRQTATFLRRLSRHPASWRNGRQLADQMVGLGALSFAQSD
jgi:hypothetical protein